MISITIHEETQTREDMAEVLDHIAGLLRDGYVRGYYPGWDTTGEEETPSLGECTYQCQKCTKVWVGPKTVPECINCGSADVLEVEYETCIHCGNEHEGKRCPILAADFDYEDIDYGVSG